MKKTLCMIIAFLLIIPCLCSCGKDNDAFSASGESWCAGFGSAEIETGNASSLYIAGYHNGWKAKGILDRQTVSAVWLGIGDAGILLVSVDCIGLSGGTVKKIRDRLSGYLSDKNCVSVNVMSTHDHAGADTLGLWGDVLCDGKDDGFMDCLFAAAEKAVREAYESKSLGKLYFGETVTENMQADSRTPYVYDKNLHSFRFVPEGDGMSFRIVRYSAHAESLRGDNRFLSRDYPGVLADTVYEKTGERVFFIQGDIGGLVMTSVQTEGEFNASENMKLTGQRLAEYLISTEYKKELPAKLEFSSADINVPLDNNVFLYAQFLGVIDENVAYGGGKTGYSVESEVGVLILGDIAFVLIPGELFPELKSGEKLTSDDPEPLDSIAKRHGIEKLLAAGLCNGELGYIIPPGDYLLDPDLPYLREAVDGSGEGHYEETNSVGIRTAEIIAEGFEKALIALGY